MKILGAYRDNAAWYYRVGAPFSVLRYRTEHEFVIRGISPNALADCDVLWLQQHASPVIELLVREFQALGMKVVYDVDDWLFGLPPSWPCYDQYYVRGSGERTERLESQDRLLALADVVTCSTQRLAANLQKRLGPGKVVEVLPNCILQGDWDTVRAAGHNIDGPVLGWFGTDNHWDDWGEIVDAVDEAIDSTGAHLALIGAPELVAMFPERLSKRTMVHPLTPWRNFDEVRRLISAFDAGLAWCTSRLEANACRSPLKALQYGAAGVPVIASETVYGDLPGWTNGILDHENVPPWYPASADTPFGIIVRDVPGLVDAVFDALADHRQEARTRADDWRAEVWRSHSYEQQAMRWLKVIEGMVR